MRRILPHSLSFGLVRLESDSASGISTAAEGEIDLIKTASIQITAYGRGRERRATDDD